MLTEVSAAVTGICHKLKLLATLGIQGTKDPPMTAPAQKDQNSEEGLPELLRALEVLAFGCHEKSIAHLLSSFDKNSTGIETFTFVEYFAVTPLRFPSDRDAYYKCRFYYPFIRRLIEENHYLWQLNSKIGYDADDPKLFEAGSRSKQTWADFSDLDNFVYHGYYAPYGLRAFDKWHAGAKVKAWLQHRSVSVKQWSHILDTICEEPPEDQEDDRQQLLTEFGLIGQPLRISNLGCEIFIHPIASANLFYGYLLVIIPNLAGVNVSGGVPNAANPGKAGQAIRRTLREEIPRILSSVYLPVLVLFHESQLEEELKRAVVGFSEDMEREQAKPPLERATLQEFMERKETRVLSGIVTKAEDLFVAKDGKEPRDVIGGAEALNFEVADSVERRLGFLWKSRSDLVPKESEIERFGGLWGDAFSEFKAKLRRLEDSLVLDSYYAASPGMVEAIHSAMVGAGNLKPPRREGKNLPCALVYGEPGSGKDKMAQLIALFAGMDEGIREGKVPTDYSSSERYVVNMAAIRPPAITGPLLQGLAPVGIKLDADNKTAQFSLEGIFVAASQVGTDSDERQSECAPAVFILDELNSLDIDLQGILLRILEQGEVTPLFGIRRQYIKHLIIGIVNEDPKAITRESEIRQILDESGTFGTIVSSLLYESVRRARHLRDDLFHRLKRDVYIEIPNLNDRREDIPILFYRTLAKEAAPRDVIVAYPVFRLLMDPQISWTGNVRQVQSLARGVLSKVSGDRIVVSETIIEKALSEQFPDYRSRFQAI